jgi:hypothetical protein
VLTEPGGNFQFALTFAEGNKLPVVPTTFGVGRLNAFVASSGHFEVQCVDRVRNVEAVILLIPSTGAALRDLDAGYWLCWSPTRHPLPALVRL